MPDLGNMVGGWRSLLFVFCCTVQQNITRQINALVSGKQFPLICVQITTFGMEKAQYKEDSFLLCSHNTPVLIRLKNARLSTVGAATCCKCKY